MAYRIDILANTLKSQLEIIKQAVKEIDNESQTEGTGNFSVWVDEKKVRYSLTKEQFAGYITTEDIHSMYTEHDNINSEAAADEFQLEQVKNDIYDLIENDIMKQYFKECE